MSKSYTFVNFIKKGAICVVVFALAFGALIASAATNSVDSLYGSNGGPDALVCGTLASLGLGCGSSQVLNNANPYSGTVAGTATYQNGNINENSNINSKGSQSNYLSASISNTVVKRSISGDKVILVKIAAGGNIRPTLGLTTSDAIFEIIKGQRHFIPTVDMFFDYGFKFESIQNISREELFRFSRMRLVQINGARKKTYYITEGSMIRPILNKEVFESYGNRDEDVVIISKKESNFYSRNQFVYVASPFTGDVFQIAENGTKKYVVPQVLRTMKITSSQIAPINKIEFNSYSYRKPIIF